mgnify:CR=1 FL=1
MTMMMIETKATYTQSHEHRKATVRRTTSFTCETPQSHS